MDIRAYNRQAWDKLVASGDRWTVPVTTHEIRRARNGDWQITGFYEDRYDGSEADPLSKYLPTFIATRAVKAATTELGRDE